MKKKKLLHEPVKFTFIQGLKSIAAAVAVMLFGGTAFFTTFHSFVRLFQKHPVYDNSFNITGYNSSKDLYHYVLFPEAEYSATLLLIGIAIAGVLTAIFTFKFITSKKMVNVYYSLGITRTKLFCGKYFSGLLLLFIAIFIPILVLFIGNIAAIGFSVTLLKASFFYFLKFALTAFASYTITSAIFAAVGTTFETAIFSAIILFIPDIFLYSIQVLMDKFLYGTPYGNDFIYANTYGYSNTSTLATLPEQFSYLSPVFWEKNQIIEFAIAEKATAKDTVPAIHPNFIYALIWTLICVAVFFLAVLIFNKRKAEICGFIGSNRYLNSAVSLLAAFAAFCAVIGLADDLLIALVLASVAFTAVHLLLEIIVLRDIKKFAKGLYKLPVGIAVSIAIVFIFNSGLFGFSQKIPDISEIRSVAVTTVGTTTEYGLFSNNYTYYASDLGYFNSPDSLVGEFTTETDIKSVLEAHKSIVQTDERDRIIENEIQFVYTLKNGNTLKRSYNNISPDSYKKLLFLEDTDFYKTQLEKYFKGTIKNYETHNDSTEYIFTQAQKSLRGSYVIDVYSKYIDKVFTVNLTETDRTKLLESLYIDISNRSAKEKYYPEESPIAFINFLSHYNYHGESEYLVPAEEKAVISEKPFSAKYSEFNISSPSQPGFFIYITTDMTNTVQALKDIGLYEKLCTAPEFVSAEVMAAQAAFDASIGQDSYLLTSISRCFLSKYSSAKSSVDGQDWVFYEKTVDEIITGTVVTDKAVIDELLKNSYTVYEQDKTDMGWFVSFTTANGDKSLCYIPDGKLPSSVSVR